MKKRGRSVKNYQETSDDAQSLRSENEKLESGDDISNDEDDPKVKRKKSRSENDDSEDLKTPKKKSGRGRKSKAEENGNDEVSDEGEVVSKSPKKKSGRGRKSKEAPVEEEENGNDDASEEDEIASKSPKKKSGRGRKSKEAPVEEEENDDLSDEDEATSKKKSAKTKSPAGRKSKNKSSDSEDKENEDNNEEEEQDEEYEVESIIDEKSVKGVRYYLVRWKGYGEESDTWEPSSTLSCPDALRDYKKKKSGKASEEKSKKGRSTKDKKTPEPVEEWDENEPFEVVRILDVYFRKDGKREFLVGWKGYPSKYDSWEPEENMDCKDLIEKFLKKCDRAKEANPKELRVQRKITDRFTLSTMDSGRRLSKRNAGKQRIHYHDAE